MAGSRPQVRDYRPFSTVSAVAEDRLLRVETDRSRTGKMTEERGDEGVSGVQGDPKTRRGK